MGWTWTCFGGRKERLRRHDSDGRLRHKNRERLEPETQTPTLSIPPSLAAQIKPKSPARDSSAYDEPFQPKQAVCGSLHGTKLFRRKTVRRNNSLGSNSFENGANKNGDKKGSPKTPGEAQPEVLVDRLQEEVEALRKRLAEEEAEARKLRNEVVYLRSCGVLQSPERISCSSIGTDSPSPGSFKDRAQRQWQSWLGLTLSPASRSKLEDQLRLMAAEEMSKNPGKGLTNGQKALIVASRLWHYQADDALHASQVKFEHRDPYASDTSSCFGNNLIENQVLQDLLPEKDVPQEAGRSKQLSKEAPWTVEEESTVHVASFRESLDLKIPPGSSKVEEINTEATLSLHETENFSFHPSFEKPVLKDVTVIQRTTSLPSAAKSSQKNDQIGGDIEECPVEEQVKFESPRRSNSKPGAAVPTSDEARRLIDVRYQELEEKLSKSPKRLNLSAATATPDHRRPQPSTLQVEDLGSLRQDSVHASSPDGKSSPLIETSLDSVEAGSDEDSPANISTPVMAKSFFSARSGRIWQPLSPVKEVNSGLSSVKSRSDIVEGDLSTDSWTTETKSYSRSRLSGNEQDGHDEASSTGGSSARSADVQDDDLFALSPRRLHPEYDPWDDDSNSHGDGISSAEVDTSADSTTTTDWNTSEDSDFDILPIQCQSPDMSPKPLRSKFAKNNNELKIKEYPRDKYLKEMGLKMDELLGSSDSTISVEPMMSSQKENQKISESFPVPAVGHTATLVQPFHESLPLSKSSSANDLTISHGSSHPVLASIENLPKWIEYQGIYVGPGKKENTEVVHQAATDAIRAPREVMHGENNECERLDPVCASPAGRAETQRSDTVYARIQTMEGSERDTHQVQVETGRAVCFDISPDQGKKLFIQNTEEKPHNHPVVNNKHHRYSSLSPGDKNEGETVHVNGALEFDLTSSRQDGVECFSPDSGGMDVDKLQLDACSSTKQRREMNVSSGFGVPDCSPKTQTGQAGLSQVKVGKSEFVEVGAGRNQNSGRQNSASFPLTPQSSVSEGSVEETESLRESCSSNEIQSPGVNKDSKVVASFSRVTDDTAYSCELPEVSPPSLMEGHSKISFSPLMRTAESATEVEANNSDSGGSERDLYPVYPVKGLLNISPDDRPILGTVATWWADESLSKSRRWWDGQGIQNSTSKYKEDQRVNWHTTPFETRLEQALATHTTVSTEPSDRRDLFGGGVESVLESADARDKDVLKPTARSVSVI